MAAVAAASPEGATPKTAIRRLHRDLASLQKSPNPQLEVRPAQDNLLEWHFVLHSLPADTPYHNGCYHGKIVFPQQYPHAPPAIFMITASGRLEVNKRLCLSMTDFHPESWNPAWSIETILVGLLSFFISNTERGYGSISQAEERRRELAAESWETNARDAEFAELFPDFLRPGGRPGASGSQVEAARSPAAGVDLEAGATGEDRQPHAGGDGDARRPAAPTEVPVESATGGGTDRPPPEGALGAAASPHGAAEVNGVGAGTAAPGTEGEGGGSGPAAGEEVPECWICRDTNSTEPLIHPCACRGSMSGVHASCVEQWVAHHRRSAVNSEVPRCSVCHQQYSGLERRPGVGTFMRQMCCKITQQICRTFTLVALLVAFQFAAAGGGLALWFRIAVITIFSLASGYKVVVLTVSLPVNQPPPQAPLARRLYVADQQQLGTHIAEAFATIMILGVWCLCGTLGLVYFLPFLLASLIPVAKALRGWQPSLQCLRAIGLAMLVFVLAPFLILGWVLSLVYRHPRYAIHPLGPGLHIAVAIALVPLCLACNSNLPLIVIWVAHSLLVAAGLFERVLIKRLQWRDGIAWWFALQLTALSTYFASICSFPEGLGAPNYSDTVVLGVSSGWLCLVSALTLAVNWTLVVQAFRTWQARHGHFTLQVPGARRQAAEVEGQRGGAGQVAPVEELAV